MAAAGEPAESPASPTAGARRPPRSLAVIVAVACAVIVVADLLVSAFSSHLRRPLYWPTWEIQHKYDALAESGTPHGVVFFGDSLMDSAVDPSLMPDLPGGAFNAALAGEPFPVNEDWATRIVVPRYHPATVVLGVGINVLSDPGHGQDGLVKVFEDSRPVAVAEGRGDPLDHVDGWLHAHVGLYCYRSVLRQPFADKASVTGMIYDPPLSAQGWNEGFRNGVQSAAAAALDQEAVNYQLDPQRLTVLSDFVRRLRSQSTHVVLVMMPVSSEYLADLAGGRSTYEAAEAAIVQRAEAGGAEVLKAGEWGEQFFADSSHLNRAGTIRFSTWIDQRLR